MKKIIFSVLALVIITVGIMAFCVIRSFNAENYKAQVITTLSQMMGKAPDEIKINGEATLSWRPMPTFVMNDLTIANQDKSAEPMIKIPQVQVEIKWLSFLKSPLVIQKIILKKPEILVERKYAYQTNFFFPVLFNPARTTEQDSLLSSTGDFLVQIDALEIDSGTLRWKNLLTNQELLVSEITGTGKVEGIDGPYSFKGSLSLLKQKFDIDIQTMKLALMTPLRMKIDLKNSGTNLNITADLDRDNKEKWLTLNGTFMAEEAPSFFQLFGIQQWPIQAPVSGSYTLEIMPQKNQLKKLILTQNNGDENLFSGEVHWLQDAQTKQDTLSVELGTFDLSKGTSLLGNFLGEMLQNNTVLDVKINQFKWHNLKAQNAQLTGKVNTGKLEDIKLNCSLAEESSLTASGKYDLKTKNFEGEISFGSMDALALVNQSFPEVKEFLPSQNFKQLQMTGKVLATPKEFQLQTTTALVDDVKFSGTLGYDFVNKQIKTQLNIPTLDLDKYYSLPSDLGQQILARVKTEQEKSTEAFDFSYNFDFSFDHLSLLGVPLEDPVFKATWTGNTLDINEISFASDENNLSLKGKIGNFGSSEPTFTQSSISGEIKDFSLFDRLGFVLPKKFIQKVQELSGSVSYSGSVYQGEMEANLESDGAQLEIKGQIKDTFSHPVLTQDDVHFYYPNLSHLSDLFYPDKHLFASYPTSVDFKGKIAVSEEKIQWQDAVLSLGDDKMDVQGAFDFKPQKLQTQMKATRFNLGLLWTNLSDFIQNPKTPFVLELPADFSADISLLSDKVAYPQGNGKNLDAHFILKDKALTIKEFSFVPSNKEDAHVSLLGTVDLDQTITVKGACRVSDLKMPEKIWHSGAYSMGNGYISGSIEVEALGTNWQEIVNSLKLKGDMAWQGAVFEGADIPIWNEAVYSALKMGQISEGFTSRLDYALKNGKTNMPTIKGKLSAQKGTILYSDIQGENKMFILKNAQFEWPLLSHSSLLKMPMVLQILKTLPPIVLDIKGSSYSLLTKDYLRAFQDEIKIKSQQLFQEQQLKEKQENDLKNAQMQKSAQSILNKTDSLLRTLQKKVILNPSKEAEQKMSDLNVLAQEIRRLAVKPDLTGAEHVDLLEKSKLLSAQAKDFESWFGVEDLMEQKKKIAQLPIEGEKMMAKMERLYQKNSRSVEMAEIVINARKVMENIRLNVKKTEPIQESLELEEMITLLKEDFIKLTKALKYMEQMGS